jgi:hypothetical protein
LNIFYSKLFWKKHGSHRPQPKLAQLPFLFGMRSIPTRKPGTWRSASSIFPIPESDSRPKVKACISYLTASNSQFSILDSRISLPQSLFSILFSLISHQCPIEYKNLHQLPPETWNLRATEGAGDLPARRSQLGTLNLKLRLTGGVELESNRAGNAVNLRLFGNHHSSVSPSNAQAAEGLSMQKLISDSRISISNSRPKVPMFLRLLIPNHRIPNYLLPNYLISNSLLYPPLFSTPLFSNSLIPYHKFCYAPDTAEPLEGLMMLCVRIGAEGLCRNSTA